MSTPIARWDVVPYQRFSTSFKIGIVAFHKNGIANIDFTITGQGFSGSNQSVSSMLLNDRTGIWEYWISLSPDDFATSGLISIDATVTGGDSDSRIMDTLYLNVDKGDLERHEAWVDPTNGSDSTGAIDDNTHPFATARIALQAINTVQGSVDGAIIYFEEGVHSNGWYNPVTSTEWLTYKPSLNADPSNISWSSWGGTATTTLLKLEGLTIASSGSGNLPFNNTASNIWFDNVTSIGSGQTVTSSNPLMNNVVVPTYYTDTIIDNVDYGVYNGTLARNVNVTNSGNDAFVNTLCILDSTAIGLDPGETTYWHADCYQCHTTPADNRIVFGFYCRDAHYQGIFLRGVGTHQNNAFVNCFIEKQGPFRLPTEGATYDTGNNGFDIYGLWDHLLVWHCTLPNSDFSFYEETEQGASIINSSWVGNLFTQFIDAHGGINNYENPSWALPGNVNGNIFEHNHYIYSAVDNGSGTVEGQPYIYSKNPDTDPSGSYSVGDPLIDSNSESSTYGYPQSGSPLISRVSPPVVPIDIFGVEWGSSADIGAIKNNIIVTLNKRSRIRDSIFWRLRRI